LHIPAQPVWSLEDDHSLNPDTTEAVFRSLLKEMIEDAKARGDNGEVVKLQNVLHYGLDALHGISVVSREAF